MMRRMWGVGVMKCREGATYQELLETPPPFPIGKSRVELGGGAKTFPCH